MTAIPLLQDESGRAPHDPVMEITARIECARARLRRAHQMSQRTAISRPAYALFEDGSLLGAIHAPNGTPVFGPAAPTVLLIRTR